VRRVGPWLLALVPLAVGAGVEVAAQAGLVDDRRLRVTVTAFRGDWWLAGGAALSAVLLVGLAVARRRDAVAERRLAAQAAAAAQDRRRLLTRLDHELKNPLTAMRAAIANLAGLGPGPDREAGVASLEEQVLRLSRLTADLRKLADVESRPADRAPVDVAGLLEDAVEVLREQPGAADRTLVLDLPRAPWPLPPVRGDADLLALAVGNLLDNALKYTPPGGRIEVRAREAAGAVVLEVADTGHGIDAAELPQIWSELYRSPAARTVPGSGLGLSLVRAVVEQHGGTVTADSRLGSGTVVRVTLPAEPGTATRPLPLPSVPAQPR
jgi:signal transduction histidine kinase